MTPEPDPSTPLTNEQLSSATSVGARMHHALTLLLGTLPPAQRTAKGVAERFDIEGVVAKRIVRAANESGGALRLLTRLPSVENLRRVTEAAREGNADHEIIDALRDSIDAFENLASSVGRGKTGLTRSLRTTLAEAMSEESR